MLTRELYNKNALKWSRQKPNCMSDFTGRPRIFHHCGDLTDRCVIDIGCGEGYASRKLLELGAKEVHGVDISDQMIEHAKKQESSDSPKIHYQVASATHLPYNDQRFDLAIAIFLYNYLKIDDMIDSLKEIYRTLKNEGKLLIAVPHPFFPYLHDEGKPSCFNSEGHSYFAGRDKLFKGNTWCLDGTCLDVHLHHKTFEDYFTALRQAGFDRIPQIEEVTVTDEHLEIEPDFFGAIKDVPLHLIISTQKNVSK